jgi:Dolichyl-phosphate-mannose-protein mannosyltransferase
VRALARWTRTDQRDTPDSGLGKGTVWAVLGVTVCAYTLLLLPSLSSQAVNWREAYVLSVGRNLCRGEGTLWLPRVDTVAEGPGTTGMELPLLNLAAARLGCGGRAQVVAARVLTLLLALVGIGAVGLLAAREFRPVGAIVAIVAFTFSPLVLFYGRTIQPDIPALSLGLLSVALLDVSLPARASTRWCLYLLSAAAMCVGALIKLPAIAYGLPLLAMVWTRRGQTAASDWRYWVYLPLATVAPAVWYLHARSLQARYGLYDFALGVPLSELARTWRTADFYRSIFVQQLFDTYAYPLISILAVGSLVLRWRVVQLWVRAMAAASVVFFFAAGHTAAWHFSYGLMAVPPIAFASTVGVQLLVERLPGAWSRAILAVGILCIADYGVWRARNWFATANEAVPIEEIRTTLDTHLPAGERVLVLSGGDPRLLWYLDRKGPVVGGDITPWLARSEHRPAAVAIDSIAVRGSAGAARFALAGAGYSPLFQSTAMEVWLSRQPTSGAVP